MNEPWSIIGGCYHCAKFVYDRCSSFDNTRSIWKMLGPFTTASRLTPTHQMLLPVLSRAASHRCPLQRRRQHVTEGTAMAHGMGPINVSIFGTFGWKTSIHPLKNRGFGTIWLLKWAAIPTKVKNGTPLHEYVSYEPSCMKIWSAFWPVG